MRILLAIIGASVNWVFHGFKNKFSDELYGGDIGGDRIPEDKNIWLGLIFLIGIGMLVLLFDFVL